MLDTQRDVQKVLQEILSVTSMLQELRGKHEQDESKHQNDCCSKLLASTPYVTVLESLKFIEDHQFVLVYTLDCSQDQSHHIVVEAICKELVDMVLPVKFAVRNYTDVPDYTTYDMNKFVLYHKGEKHAVLSHDDMDLTSIKTIANALVGFLTRHIYAIAEKQNNSM